MERKDWPMRIVTRPRLGAAACCLLALAMPAHARRVPFTDTFMTERCTFSSQGRNPYFILEPGYRLTLESQSKGEHVVLTITVLHETLMVDGVETRIVEEHETVNDVVAEISRNYFALCAPSNTVFYFGEDVDNYENGAIANHDGSWRAGVNGARAGVNMPGLNLVGARYFQEVAPGVALDRAETQSVTESVSTPLGQLEHVLKVKESSALEKKARSLKLYAPDIGLIKDDDLEITGVTAP